MAFDLRRIAKAMAVAPHKASLHGPAYGFILMLLPIMHETNLCFMLPSDKYTDKRRNH
jgi:hypothetical protein